MYKLPDGTSIPHFNKPAVTAPQKARTEPTERSIPEVNITSVIPTEMQMLTEICRITFHALSTVKNLSDIKLMPMQSSINAMSD